MKKLIFLLLSIISYSCDTNDDAISNNPEYSEYFTKNSIEVDINFMPKEVHYSPNTPQTPSLILALNTVEIYRCDNYTLGITKFTNGNELIIRLDEVLSPEICLTAFGPASTYIDLPENISNITFINGNIIDKYSIDIDQEKVSITPIQNKFTHSLYDKTFRYPEKSFVLVCGTNIDNTHIYDDFLTILQRDPNFTEFEFEGQGRIPYPESSSGHWVNHPAKFFTYLDQNEFENLKNILNTYSAANIGENSGVSISIYSWNGIAYYSWAQN